MCSLENWLTVVMVMLIFFTWIHAAPAGIGVPAKKRASRAEGANVADMNDNSSSLT